MSSASLSRGDRRAVARGALAILVILAVFRGAPEWWKWRNEVRTSASDLSGELRAVRADIGGLGVALDSAEARVARLKRLGVLLIAAADAAEGAATAVDVVAEAARLVGVHIDGLEASTIERSTGAIQPVTVTGRATVDAAGLIRLLEGIEGGAPLIAVRRLTVRPHELSPSFGGPELLQVRFTVEMLVLLPLGNANP